MFQGSYNKFTELGHYLEDVLGNRFYRFFKEIPNIFLRDYKENTGFKKLLRKFLEVGYNLERFLWNSEKF